MNPLIGSISILRILGMFMIVVCHVGTFYENNIVGQFFNVGVQLFLFISGWLYSKKDIRNSKEWLKQRWIKICVPMYIWSLIVALGLFFLNLQDFKISTLLMYFLNLQGLPFLFKQVNVSLIAGTGHLWFLTAIALCYIFTIGVKKIEQRFELTKKRIVVLIVCGTILLIVMAYRGIILEWIYVYFLGYLLARVWKITPKNYLLSTISMFCAMVIRLLAREVFDGTVFYEEIVVSLTHNVLAIWIFATVMFLDEYTNIIKLITKNKVIISCEKISYYVYITHYVFLSSVIGLKTKISQEVFQMLVFIVLTGISAVILKSLYEWLLNRSIFKWKKRDLQI